jgi:uncharacterized protein Veg
MLDIQGYNTIEKMRDYLKKSECKYVHIKINNIRNKSEEIFCKVKEIYPRHFVVETNDGIKRSFSYVDILTGNVEIESKRY